VTPAVLLLVLASAGIHVAWNVVARSARGSAAFPWLVNVAGALVLAPAWLARRFDGAPALATPVIALAALSALFEAAYFLLLQASYGRSELSVVYPLSRGIAPLLALLPGRALAGDSLTARELAGVLVVLAGTACVARSGTRAPEDPSARALARRGILFTLLVGAATAGYQVVDRRAMQLAESGAALEYLATMQAFLAALLTLAWGARATRDTRRGRPPRPVERRELAVALVAALGIQAAYFLVLVALRDGNVTLVSAARNVGIPLSLIAGALVLRERIGGLRIGGAVLIVAGVLLTVG
jgi:drug/metabolite transporter (DMT)-like permease